MSDDRLNKIIVSAVEGDEESTSKLINYFEKKYKDCHSDIESELADEAKNVRRVVYLCRKVAMGLKSHLQDPEKKVEEEMLPEKYVKALQETILYKQVVGIIFLETYLSEKFKWKKGKWTYSAGVERVPVTGQSENGDDPALQHKRRYGNNHTIKMRLKKLWDIDIQGKKRELEYNKLCDLVESVVYKMDTSNKQDKEQSRVKTRIQLFALFDDRKKKPLDLFDNSLHEEIFSNAYRYVVKEFIQEVGRAAGNCTIIKYTKVRCFWKRWYSNFLDDIYIVALSNNSVATVKNFYSTRFIIKDQELPAVCQPMKNLFSEVLFYLLKEEMKNNLYNFKYILNHSNFVMSPLDIATKLLFNDWAIITEHCTYDVIWLILDQNKENVKALLGNDVDIGKVFLQVKKILEIIIKPRGNEIVFYNFLALMQCCVESQDSFLIIEHYGMTRGNKMVSLGKIIKRPQDNNCKEVRLFLFELMRRRSFLNLFDEETVIHINGYRIMWEDVIEEFIDGMKQWKDIEPTLESLQVCMGNAHKL